MQCTPGYLQARDLEVLSRFLAWTIRFQEVPERQLLGFAYLEYTAYLRIALDCK
jgi:hypothetical protein